MSDFVIRPVADVDAELRATQDVFLGALHVAPITDERWKYLAPMYQPGRTFGAYLDSRVIGTTLSFGSTMTVPGGASLPMAAVTGVGVRADQTRRGVLTELMRAQLAACAAAGDVLAGLHASEGCIYGRFGYGVASLARLIKVNARRAALRPEVPRAGEVHLVEGDEALALIPKIYERLRGSRPGLMTRTDGWWSTSYERRLRASDEHVNVAVHVGPDGEDGFAAYLPEESRSEETTLRVPDMHGTPGAINDLWRFLLGIDLVGEILGSIRPMDEPVEAMVVDQRAVSSDFGDEIWLRLLDVPAALAARTYGVAEPVVLEVRDRLLPANSGRYRVTPDGAARTEQPADLALDAAELAMLYLGGTRASVLAGIGRAEVIEASAVLRTDRLFATDQPGWCGTMF